MTSKQNLHPPHPNLWPPTLSRIPTSFGCGGVRILPAQWHGWGRDALAKLVPCNRKPSHKPNSIGNRRRHFFACPLSQKLFSLMTGRPPKADHTNKQKTMIINERPSLQHMCFWKSWKCNNVLWCCGCVVHWDEERCIIEFETPTLCFFLAGTFGDVVFINGESNVGTNN